MDLLPITTKLELNILKPYADVNVLSRFAIKHRCHAIVAMPEFIPVLLADRAAKNGQYKIIAAVDFPDGKNFCYDKFKTFDAMTLEVDGMDIVLTKNKTEVDVKNEAKALIEFLHNTINPLMDIRFVIGYYCNVWKDVDIFLKAIHVHPPNAIRIDQHVELPKLGYQAHKLAIKKLRKYTPKLLKISGNLNLQIIRRLLELDKNLRFDVTMQQATRIVNDSTKQ